MKLDHHSFPAYLKEMGVEDEKEYSKTRISHWMAQEIQGGLGGPCGTARTPLANFFDATQVDFDPKAVAEVTWTGFPLRVKNFWTGKVGGGDYELRWAVADSSRIYQDEYLEWSVKRISKNLDPNPNPNGNDFECDIASVAFTCEGPEYWQFFGMKHPEKMAPTYIKYNPSLRGVDETDLNRTLFMWQDVVDDDPNPDIKKAIYNPNNYYNFNSTSGTIMHLIHPSNTLSAEIDIAAQATVIRTKKGKVIDNANDLIACSQYGNPNRDSDPNIGLQINRVVRGTDGKPKSITVADPVALYINSLDISSFQLDYSKDQDQSDLRDIPSGTFRCTRGDLAQKQGLRIEVSIPHGVKGASGKQLNISNIWDSNTKTYIHYGAQIADYIRMSVTANAILASDPPKPQPCPCDKQTTHAMHAEDGSASLLAQEKAGMEGSTHSEEHSTFKAFGARR